MPYYSEENSLKRSITEGMKFYVDLLHVSGLLLIPGILGTRAIQKGLERKLGSAIISTTGELARDIAYGIVLYNTIR